MNDKTEMEQLLEWLYERLAEEKARLDRKWTVSTWIAFRSIRSVIEHIEQEFGYKVQ